MLNLNDREMWAAVSTIVLPLLISLVQQPTWSDRVRAVVAFIAVFVWTGLGVLWLGDGVPQRVDYHSIVRLLLTNFLVTWGTYSAIYKPAGITQFLEAKTSPNSVAKRALLSESKRRGKAPRTPEGE